MARVMTVKSDDARDKMREMLEHVAAGGMVQITRYNRLDGILISPKEYERLNAAHLRLVKEEADRAWASGEYIEFAPEESITDETIDHKARAKGWALSEPA